MIYIRYILIGYLIIINITAFAAYAMDKGRSKRHMWRVPEATLLMLAALGGSAGAFIAMHFLHHKTKHPRFYLGVPVLLLIHIALCTYIFWKIS